MTGKIFLSYQREDAAAFARALFLRLEQSFPAESLFMDVEGGIGAGQDFVRVIEEQVGACDVMLVLIGPNWLTVRDETGRPRLENPEDFVRIEVESALRFGKHVIPVLVHKTAMPRADALPEALKALARRNAVGLTPERFKADTQGLIKALEDALAEVEAARRQAETEAAEQRRAAEEAAKAEENARAEKERTRLEAITGLSPEQIAKAEELANWDFIKASESIEEFRDHLARFPQGVTERMARKRLETLVWAGLPRPVDTDVLKGFLAEFPNGAHAGEANAKLAELDAQAAAARAEERIADAERRAREAAEKAARTERALAAMEVEFRRLAQGSAQPRNRRYYVSYAWADVSDLSREKKVDELCAEAEGRGIEIIRDKVKLRSGDRISTFMKEIGLGDRVFVFLSDKYLKSAFCMKELFEMWRNSRQNELEFLKQVRLITLDDARIWDIDGRLEYASYWDERYERLRAALAGKRPTLLGDADFRSFRLMEDFARHVGNILVLFADAVQPQTFEEFLRYGLDDLPEGAIRA
jgi:TIR domain